ncbi:MAG: DUF368 domain-containing protein [Candidatus Omnitrophica bacterium]|nr:DUF368 domain-containing protein [Candidatus Omnitrophota bacterium]
MNYGSYIIIILKGMCMGVADVIPGVSGGTIALLLGIYERFIHSLKSFDLELLKMLCKGKFLLAIEKTDAKFLCSLLLGIGLSILFMARIIEWLFEHHPTYIRAFFFGLIMATVFIIAKFVKQWKTSEYVLFILFSLLTYGFVGQVPFTTPKTPVLLFLSGFIAISAMILPGISGSYILVLLGKYQQIISAVNDREFFTLGIFLFGMICGILVFVRVLSWLFRHFHDKTLAILTGIVLGSLRKIWPWQEVSLLNEKISENILPAHISAGEWICVISIFLCGFVVASIMNRAENSGGIKLSD